MKITPSSLLPLALVLACARFAGAAPNLSDDSRPFDIESAENLGPRNVTQDTEITVNTPAQPQDSSASTLAKCNRASGLIGMTVRNQQNERLGRIKDIVLDLNSDRVAYVVMSAKGTGSREKLLAVPLTAFSAGPNDRSLVMQADKDKLDSAAGIVGNNWPSPNNPTWGAEPSFWQSETNKIVQPEQSTPTTQDKNLDQSPKPDYDQPKDLPENK